MKHFKTSLALVLALVLAFVMPLRSMAAGDQYVSEVYVAYGGSADSARQALLDRASRPLRATSTESAASTRCSVTRRPTTSATPSPTLR